MQKFTTLYKFFLIGLLLACYPLTSLAKSIDKVVVFGDSLSDNGNLYAYTMLLHAYDPSVKVLPVFPYALGRFSNGAVWGEDLVKQLSSALHKNVKLSGYALGGAWVESSAYSQQEFPFSVKEQIALQYLLSPATYYDSHKADHLYIIWGGSNDYLLGRVDVHAATDQVINGIKANIDLLYKAGARKFLIPNLPDLGKTPYASVLNPVYQQNLSELAQLHNKKLAELVAQEQRDHPEDKFMLLDIESNLNQIIQHPEQYGLSNVTDPCLPAQSSTAALADMPGVQHMKQAGFNIEHNPLLAEVYRLSKDGQNANGYCSDPDHYLFWDQLHPTAVIHKLLSEKAYALLQENHMV